MHNILTKLRTERDPRSQQGFTFTELLVSLLIMVLLATLVAQSIPVAFSTYRQVVADSNAQVALSTTTSALRDELGLAVDAKPGPNGKLFYQTAEGSWAMIDNGGTNSLGLVKHVYFNTDTVFNPAAPGTEIETVDLIPRSAIVGATGGDDLRVQMVASSSGFFITYSNGVFTVNRIEVLIGGQAIESVENFKVKAILDPTP